LVVHDVPGDHDGMVVPPVLDLLARQISADLAAVTSRRVDHEVPR
jgi:hypothetical protein